MAERLQGGGGDLKQPVNKNRLFKSCLSDQGRGAVVKVAGRCELHGHVWKVIKYFETMTGVLERDGEGGRPVRVAVSLKSPEIKWIWDRDEDVVMGEEGAGSGEVGSGAAVGGTGPLVRIMKDGVMNEGM